MKRDYLGISELGQCCRRVYLAHTDLEPEISPETARVFELGHLIEAMRKRELRRSKQRVMFPQKEVRFGPALGHIDLMLRTQAGPVLVEVKSTTAHSVRKWQKENLPRHIAFQIQGYMAGLSDALGEVVKLCRLDVVDRTSGQVFVWTYERDPFVENAALERAVFLAERLRSGSIPDQEFDESSGECRYCVFRSTCRPEAVIPTETTKEHLDAGSWPGFNEALELYEAGQGLKAEGEQFLSQPRETILAQLAAHNATKAKASGALVSWSQVNTTKFDSKLLQQEKPEIYAQFLKPSQFSRLEIRR